MNAPLSNGADHYGRKPTRQQLEAARVRARTTGEPFEQVLAVFLGAGRYGSEAVPAVAPPAGHGGAPAEPERLAAVLPFPESGGGRKPDGSAEEQQED
jgi:hypothetical protein